MARFKGNGHFTSEPLFQNNGTCQSRAVLQLCLLFHYLHECFITARTRLRSAANQHDPLSLSILLSLESIYCTSGNAAELDEVAAHPGAHSTDRRRGQHIPIPCAHMREMQGRCSVPHSITWDICEVFILFCVCGYKVMKVIEHKITDTSHQIGNDLGADSTTDTEFHHFRGTATWPVSVRFSPQAASKNHEVYRTSSFLGAIT